MNEIKCPNCGTVFQINETDYDKVVKQIRDKEFEKELKIRETQHKESEEAAVKIVKANLEKETASKLNEKDIEISKLQQELKSKEEQVKSELEKKHLEELNKSQTEINELKNRIESITRENKLAIKNIETEKEKEEVKKIGEKEQEITKLQNE